MYGTVLIARLADGYSAEDVHKMIEQWQAERKVPGYVDSRLLAADDDRTVVQAVRFESKRAYLALADDPVQDEWWRNKAAPMLDGEPRWIDGTWLD